MKNPLRYQLSEYDCGPTSLLNAMSFLFERKVVLLFNKRTKLTAKATMEYMI